MIAGKVFKRMEKLKTMCYNICKNTMTAHM